MFPDKIEKVILYGSYARNEPNNNSDIDILVICRGVVDAKLREQIYGICYDINSKYDVWIDLSLLSENDLNTIRGKQPFVRNAFAEGIFL